MQLGKFDYDLRLASISSMAFQFFVCLACVMGGMMTTAQDMSDPDEQTEAQRIQQNINYFRMRDDLYFRHIDIVRLELHVGVDGFEHQLKAHDKLQDDEIDPAHTKGFVFQTVDPGALKAVAIGLSPHCALMPAVGVGTNGGFSAGPTMAYLHVVLKDKTLKIGISSLGLIQGEELPHLHSLLYSYHIAQVVDEMYRAKTGMHIPVSLFRAMSGEQHIEESRNEYARFYRFTELGVDRQSK